MSEREGNYTQKDFERDMGLVNGEQQPQDRADAIGVYDEFTEKKEHRGKDSKEGHGGKRRHGKKKRSEKRTWKRSLVLIVLALLCITGCVAILLHGYLNDKLDKVNRVKVKEADWGIDPKVAEELKDYKNILLLGVDTRENRGEDVEHTRSDGIIIVTINKNTNEVVMTSVYRDSYLCLEEEGYYNIDKVTHAHAYGGPVNTVRALNRNLDLNIDDLVRVDWRAVMEVTDALGGLEVDVSETELHELNRIIKHTAKSLGVKKYQLVKHTGKQTLNGVQIAAYCRIRKTDGDTERAERMREVIMAAIEKAKKMNLSELNKVIDVGMKDITTSMTSKTMMGLIMDMAKYDFKKGDGWPYKYAGAMINSIWYDVPVTLKSQVKKLHKKLFGQEDYKPTDRVLIINERVKYESQYYGGENQDWELLQQYDAMYGGRVESGK